MLGACIYLRIDACQTCPCAYLMAMQRNGGMKNSVKYSMKSRIECCGKPH